MAIAREFTINLVGLSISLLRLNIWLMVYSPYLLFLAAAAYGYTQLRRRQSSPNSQAPDPPNTG